MTRPMSSLFTLFSLLIVYTTCSSNTIPLKGKTVLVTGASSGIGEAVAREFAAKGLNVVLSARRKESLDKIVKEIQAAGGSAFAVTLDVSSKLDVAKAFRAAEEKFGPVHFTVANAAVLGSPLDITTEQGLQDVEFVFQTDVLGLFYTLREGIISAKKGGGGAIVLVSSMAGSVSPLFFGPGGVFPGTSSFIAYSASKSAVDAIARAARAFVTENIRVYSVAPHVYETPMASSAASAVNSETELLAKYNPFFKTPGDPRDLAPVMTAIFDNSTLYTPGSLIFCDNKVTFDGQEYHKQMYGGKFYDVPRSVAKNFRGEPFVWPETKSEL